MNTKSFKLSGQQGFSLVELLVVIAVIAIIAAIAIPNIANITSQATFAKNQRNAQNIASVATAAVAAGYPGTAEWTSKSNLIVSLTSGTVSVANTAGGGAMTFSISPLSATENAGAQPFFRVLTTNNVTTVNYIADGTATN